jgi:hypothetical protein
MSTGIGFPLTVSMAGSIFKAQTRRHTLIYVPCSARNYYTVRLILWIVERNSPPGQRKIVNPNQTSYILSRSEKDVSLDSSYNEED